MSQHHIEQIPSGWPQAGSWAVFRVDGNQVNLAAGPFPLRGSAVAWIAKQGQQVERQQRARSARARARLLTPAAIARALHRANENPPPAPRGRPPVENPLRERIAVEYFWRLRFDKAHASVEAVAKLFRRRPGFVRECIDEYAPVRKYRDRWLVQMRAEHQRPRQTVRAARIAPGAPLEQATLFLNAYLASGPKPAAEILRRCHAVQISERTLNRAKKQLGVLSCRAGKTRLWSLPATLPNC